MPKRIPFARTSNQSAASTAAEYKRRPEYREAHAFYNSARWRKLRAAFLRANPLCQDCEKLGRVTLATEVHHVKERRDHPELAYSPENLAGLCKRCHGRRRGA
jgi:5-methylcytosine-specific restriction endonuclease McrA